MHPFPQFGGGIYTSDTWSSDGNFWTYIWMRGCFLFLFSQCRENVFNHSLIQCAVSVHVNRRGNGHTGLPLFWCNHLYLSPPYNPSLSVVLSKKKLFLAKERKKPHKNVFFHDHNWDCQLYTLHRKPKSNHWGCMVTKPFLAKGKDILSNILLMRKFYYW